MFTAVMTAKTSRNLQPAIMKLYRGQMNAFQLAITSFIQGYREGAAEKADLSSIFPDPGSAEAVLDQRASNTEKPSAAGDTPGYSSSQASSSQEAKTFFEGASPASSSTASDPDSTSTPVGDSWSQLAAAQNRDAALAFIDREHAIENSTVPQSSREVNLDSQHSQPSHMSAAGKHAGTSAFLESPEAPTDQLATSSAVSGRQYRSSDAEKASPSGGPMADQQGKGSEATLDGDSQALTGGSRNRDSPEVLHALGHAEELASALLKPGGMTPARRKELEIAIAKAEAAMGGQSIK